MSRAVTAPPRFDVARVRADFPILHQEVNGHPLAYLDNAASTQKPRAVIDAISRFYERDNSNIHRGLHALSQRATDAYEAARVTVARFLGTPDPAGIVFVRGTTEAINLVARTWGDQNVRSGDEILLTGMEHHSNIVPWQLLCERAGATIRVAPVTEAGEIDLAAFARLLTPKTRLVAFTHVSNALGTVNPAAEMIRMAHAAGAVTVVDGAQAVAHMPVDVAALDADFYAFSGHKLYGPTGIGILYGRTSLLNAMPPYEGGGDMIASVSFEKTTYNKVPQKFEAGTPDIAGAIGLGAAIDYFETAVGRAAAAAYEEELLAYATRALSAEPGVTLVGTSREKASVLSFLIEGIHPHDIGTILDQQGIAIRAGHHCAQPLMERLGIPATARASIAFYNTREEIDRLAAGIRKVKEIMGA